MLTWFQLWNFNLKKYDKFNYITSAMLNAYLISTLKFEKIKYFWEIQKNLIKNEKLESLKKLNFLKDLKNKKMINSII